MNKDLETEIQEMIDKGASEEAIGVFIKDSIKKKQSEPLKVDNNSNDDKFKAKSGTEFEKLKTPRVESKLFKLFPFAFDIVLIIVLGNLINSFGEVKDYYGEEILFSFCTLFSMIVLAKWYWNYKEPKTGIIVKNYIFYLLLFSALLFGIFYIILLPK